MSLISVIVPIYKVEDYLEKCVDSLLCQTFNDLEIILVDDGSPDHCGKICDEYVKKDSRVRVIHKENGGLVSARKAGAREATGDYVACVDGDDWVSLEYFEHFAKVLQQYDADIVCCGHWNAFEGSNEPHPCNAPAGYYGRDKMERDIYPFLIEGKDNSYFDPTLWGKVFRRELYVSAQEKVDDRISICEDFVCTRLCISNANSMYILEDCLYYYRQNPQSMTKKKRPFSWPACELVASFPKEHIDISYGDFENQIRRRIIHDAFNVAVTQFYSDRPYREIVSNINNELSKPLYADAIKNCDYQFGSMGYFARMALKYRLYWLMWIYSKIK